MKRVIFQTIFCLVIFFISYHLCFATYGETITYTGLLYNGDGEEKMLAYFDFPEDVKINSNGESFIADTYNNVIRKIDTNGIVLTIAGTGSYGFTDGAATTAAEFALPRGVTFDSSGNLYVADTFNNAIRKVSSGSVSTLVTDLNGPEGIVVYNNQVYFLDTGNNALKRVSVNGGSVATICSSLNTPKKLDITANGQYAYVANEGSHQIIKVNLISGAKEVIVGSGTSGYQEGVGTGAKLNQIWGVALAENDTVLYFSDGDGFTDYIRKVDLATKQTYLFADDSDMVSINFPAGLDVYDGSVYVSNQGIGTIHRFWFANPGETLAADGEIYAGAERFGNRNTVDGEALFGRPYDLVMTADRQYLYVADNNKIRKIKLSTGEVSHVIGHSVDNYREGWDDPSWPVRFSTIQGITINSAGTVIYLTDRWNNRIRKIDLTLNHPTSSLISGAGLINTTGTQDNGYQEGTKCLNQFNARVSGCAYFQNPAGIVISPDDQYLYVTDTGNNRIRKIVISTGSTSLIAGSGTAGFADGPGSSAKFDKPFGLTIDSAGENLFVADTNNHRIRKIEIATGTVSTVAGSGLPGYRDAIGPLAYFSFPEYVKMGSEGNLYVSEVGSHRIRIIDPETGLVRLVSGSGERGYKNGARAEAEFNNPKGLAPDFIGKKLYLADSWNDLIRQVNITGEAPYTEPAPTISNLQIMVKTETDDPNKVLPIIVTGGNFVHGTEIYFWEYEGRTYIISNTQLTVEIPLGRMEPGWYDVVIQTPDGQRFILEGGFGVADSATGLVPDIYYTVEREGDFLAYDANITSGVHVASGDINGDGIPEIITAPNRGAGPQVRVFNRLGALLYQYMVYDSRFRGGVRIAAGDLEGDGTDEIICLPASGGGSNVVILGLRNGNLIPTTQNFFVFDRDLRGGFSLTLGDLEGDGKAEAIIAPTAGGSAHVMIYGYRYDEQGRGLYRPVILGLKVYAEDYHGGITLAAGDVNGDDKDEIITGIFSHGGPHVRILARLDDQLVHVINPGFYAFAPQFHGGIMVATADRDGDGTAEIVTSVRSESSPLIRVFQNEGRILSEEFYAFGRTFAGGVAIAGGDLDNDGDDDLITGRLSGGNTLVRVY